MGLRTALRQRLYEELHPYGTSAYRSARSGVEVSERRYRYTGKERDDETGFQIHGLRYYVPWLGRWTTSDPIGLQGGLNGYGYCRGDPVGKVDPGGTQDFRPSDRTVTFEDGRTTGAPPIEVTDQGQVLPETVVRGGDDPDERAAQERKNVQTNKAEKMAYAADQARQNSVSGFLSGVGLPLARRAVGAAEFVQNPNGEDVAQAAQVFKPGGGIDMNAIAARILRLGSGEATGEEWGETASPFIMAAATAGAGRAVAPGAGIGAPTSVPARFATAVRLEVRALELQGLTRSEAFAQVRVFNAGAADGFAFHFTNPTGGRGIVGTGELHGTQFGLGGCALPKP